MRIPIFEGNRAVAKFNAASIYENVPLKLLIAEDERLLAELLVQQFAISHPDATVTSVHSVTDLQKLPASCADIAVVDLILADGCTLSWANRWTAENPTHRVIILTSRTEEFIVHSVLTSAVAGIVHKTDGLASLELAVRAVTAGGTFFSPRIQALRTQMHGDPDFFPKILSGREQMVLQLIGEGKSVAEIAKALALKTATVVDHRKNVMRKLNLHSQSELLAYTLRKGFRALGMQPTEASTA